LSDRSDDHALAPVSGLMPVTLPGGRAAVRRDEGRTVRIGWPEFGPPMFYPTRAVDLSDNILRVAHDLGQEEEVIEEVDLRFRWTMAEGVQQILPYVMYGQSLALCIGHDKSLTAEPVAPGRALTYANSGAGAQLSVSERPGKDQHDFGPCHFPQSDLDRLEDLRESRGESPVSAAVRGFLPGLAQDVGVIATNHARGGVAMRKLLPRRISQSSGIQYAGILRAAVRTLQFCDIHGCQMLQPILSFIHGEAFQPDDWRHYGERLVQLQSALSEDFRLLTTRDDPVLMFTDQARVTFRPEDRLHPNAIPAAIAQLRTAQANPGRIFCVGPKYFLPRRSTVKGRGDPVHLTASSSRLLGDYHGRAIRQTLLGEPWLPLHVAHFVRDGNRITLTVAGGDGSPLMIDTERVARTANSELGFHWTQEGGTIPKVAEVAVKGRQIIVTLTADPGQAGTTFKRAALSIGLFADAPVRDDGPATGGRTNIRDCATDVGSGGEPMFNWLCHDWFWETEGGSAR